MKSVQKRGVSHLTTVLVVILTVLVILGLFYLIRSHTNFSGNTIQENQPNIDSKIENVLVDDKANTISFNLNDDVNFAGNDYIKFIFYNGDKEEDKFIYDLSERDFSFHLENMKVGDITDISFVLFSNETNSTENKTSSLGSSSS